MKPITILTLLTITTSGAFAQTIQTITKNTIVGKIDTARGTGIINIPLDDGNLLLRDIICLRQNTYDKKSYVPELSFTSTNNTSSPWHKVKLEIEIDLKCKNDPEIWTHKIFVDKLKFYVAKDTSEYREMIPSLVGKVEQGCESTEIRGSLLFAENRKLRIDVENGERVDLAKQNEELNAKREDERRLAAEAQARNRAVEAAREERQAAEQRKQRAAADARYARLKAEQDVKDAQERARIRAACSIIYQKTAEMKTRDLTVKQEQQVRACQALGLYPPH